MIMCGFLPFFRKLKYLRISALLILFIFQDFNSFGQKQGNNWYFGNHAGVNFNTVTPTVLTNGATTSANNLEGTATISDTNGNLLFYTDGQTVWNRNHVVMTNGTGLMGNSSSTQAAVIVPRPGSLDSFFIFTVDDCQHNLANGLRYSVVKMSLSGGLGAVTGTKNILLSPPGVTIAEKITAVKHCNNKDIWVIVHGYGATYGGNFYVWLITSSGIILYPASSVGTVHRGGYVAPYSGVGNSRGYMKASPNGRKIALAICYDGAPDNQDPTVSTTGSFELFDFNNLTGAVTNPLKFGPLNIYKGAYGVEFSPGGALLYGTTWGNYNSPKSVYQWNLNAGSPAAIKSSAVLLATVANNPGALQLARNGKIYIVKDMSPNGYLDCINNPNNVGATCIYQNNAVFLTNGHYGLYGLPTFIQSYFDPGFNHTNNFVGRPTYFKISDTTLIDSVYWNFGDPASGVLNFSKIFSPFHIYSDTGKFNIVLILYKCNIADTLKSSIYIYALPIVVFTINDSDQCFPGNSFNFTNASHMTGGTITGYLWRFGDGATTTTLNASHNYTTPGIYKVWLTATSNLGAKDSLGKNVYVYPMPVSGFSINDSNQCFKKNKFIFTNTSTISFGTMNYKWKFGDGDTTGQKLLNPVHSYSVLNNYIIKLVVTSNGGCKDSVTKRAFLKPSPIAAYTISDSTQCLSGNNFSFTNNSTISSGTITCLWRFGDNTTSNLVNANHQYLINDTFTVTLTANSNGNCVDSVMHNIYVYPEPKTVFSINDTDQCQKGNQFIFTNNTTIQSGSYTWKWYFGDAATSVVKNPAHNYLNFGTYPVKLVNVSTLGCKDSLIKTVYIYPMPKASFSINDSDQCFRGNKFIFTNLTTIGSGTLTYLWQFGDAGTSNQVNPQHSYIKDINYSIKLTATSDHGCIDSLRKNVFVFPSPAASFTVKDSVLCLKGNSILFRNHSAIDKGTIKFDWNFGDGFLSKAVDSFTHQYSSFGIFTAKLLVTSNIGCKDSVTKNIVIFPMPLADFTINNPMQCLFGNSFLFTNNTSIPVGSLTYFWTLGDSTNSVLNNVTHSYAAHGTYKIKLVATSQGGCVDSISKQVTVHPIPTANFKISHGCLEDTTYFSNLSTVKPPDTITSYLWDFGDGNTSVLKNPVNVYMLEGIFMVTLKVSSDNGCFDQVVQQVLINPHVGSNVITRATVDSDQTVLIEWEPVNIGSPMIYVLERSVDNRTFTEIKRLSLNFLSYIDRTASVKKQSNIYRMKILDSCNFIGPASNIAKTIWLTYEYNTLHPILHWTPYRDWAEGIKEYRVELLDETYKAFLQMGIVVDDTTFEDHATHLNQSEYCYRVVAVRPDGVESVSNIACIATPFDLWVPDAFSPNEDNFNNVFRVMGKYVFEFHIRIYDRWGETVYTSDNIDETWDGTYKGAPCEEGNYFYHINGKGTKGQSINLDGLLMLIR